MPSVIEKHELDHHLDADDTHIADHLQLTQAAMAITNIERCVESVHVWCTSKRLQLNPTKSEIIWFGSRTSLHHLQGVDLSLHICADIIAPLSIVCDLDVLLDSELSMTSHITKISIICYYQFIRLKQVRRFLEENIKARLVSTFIISRLDYCNAILAGLPQSMMASFQHVKNAMVRMIKRLGARHHITEARHNLHWLLITYRVIYKLCILMHMVHIDCGPGYISELVSATSALPVRSRRRSSGGNRYELLVDQPQDWSTSFLLCWSFRLKQFTNHSN